MIRHTVYCCVLLAILLIGFLPGCVPISSHRNSDPYTIRHHTWWNYYGRGRIHLRDGNYSAARSDFETALGKIPGARYPYAQERWRARTYGMHMIEGYFPHRELGICLFYMNESTEALPLLEASMEMEPSARAKFYINLIHAQLAEAAAPPPDIEIAPLPAWISRRTALLQGSVRGSNKVVRITINGEPEFIELAKRRAVFQRELQLREGSNQIHIVAEDIAGKQTATNLVLMADWTPPKIHLHRNGSELSITCQDNHDLNQIQVSNHIESPVGNEYTLNWPIETGRPITMTVSDSAGNRTEWTLSEKELAHMAQSRSSAPPRLHLANAGKTLVLFNPEYGLDIRAEDDTALRSVELNGEALLTHDTPLFRTLRRIPLVPGTNHLALAAEDSDGNRTEEYIDVVYREPEYLDSLYRLTAMLSPLAGEIPDPAFARRVDHLVGDNLTIEPVRFYLLATDNEIRKLQSEQSLSESEWADPRAMLTLGKQLEADLLFSTRVLSDAPGQTIYTRILDARSGEELFLEDVYVEDPSLLPSQLNGLVMKIEQRFPVIQGCVQALKNGLIIDAGERNGARKSMRLLVIRSEGSFEQGRVIQAGNRPAELVISEVESDSAEVILPRGQPKGSVHAGDFVFSR